MVEYEFVEAGSRLTLGSPYHVGFVGIQLMRDSIGRKSALALTPDLADLASNLAILYIIFILLFIFFN